MIAAYLDLLKLCLGDLAGAGTTSGAGQPGGGVKWRELGPDELDVRIEGRDWPRHGLTMGGLLKLDDLQRCVETIVRDGVSGDLIELGTWRGGSSILMRATLDCLGARDRTVWMADSFQGFPKHVPGAERAYARTLEPFLAAFEYLVAPLEDVKHSVARLGLEDGVRFVPGFFADTVPGLMDERWSLLRLDADTYDPTMLILESLYPGLSVGGYAVIDDYGALEECRAAVDRYRSDHGITEPLEEVDWCCVRWRKER
jgi:O-methyltransferase